MEILQLRYFYESAASENFARTAEKYMVPTTSVSASVKRLERELGTPLFERHANRITLTDAGRRLQKSLCLVFAELDTVKEAITPEKEDGRALSLLVRAVRSQVTDRIIAFHAEHPEIAFRTAVNFEERDITKYDIIIDTENPAYATLSRFELCSMRIRMMAQKGHPLAGKPITLRTLCDEPMITWGEGSNMHEILLSACHAAGFSPRIAASVGDKECYEKLVASGVGIGLGREDIPMRGTEELAITDFDERYTVYVYYKTAACFGNVARFVEFLRNSAKNLDKASVK